MKFFRNSISQKLTALLLISIIIPIVSSIIITYVYTKESLKSKAIEENIRLISEMKTNVTNYLDIAKNASLNVYSNTTLENILIKGTADYESESYIFMIMSIVSRSTSDTHQVFLRVIENQRSYLLCQNNLIRGGMTYQSPLLNEIVPYRVFIEPTHLSHNYGIHNSPFENPIMVFTIHRPIYRIPSNQQIGLISADIRLDGISKLISQLYEKDGEDVYILDDRTGTVIYASKKEDIGIVSQESWVKQILANPNISGYQEWNKDKFSGILIFTKLSSSYLNWTMVKLVPYSYLYKYPRRLTLINTIMAAIFLSLAMLAVLIVSLQLTKPIKQLISHIRKIESGQLELPLAIDRSDEIGVLAQQFQKMMNTINNLILAEYKLNLANKTNQLNMLQAQINPHFINNALQSIGSLALESNAPKVYLLISSLGQMMYYTTNMKETIVTLSQEVEYVKFYCILQQQRFDDKLQVEFDIAENTNAIRVPKMIIQPLVENSFKHGFITAPNRVGTLMVRTLIKNKALLIIIEDNGIGISPDKLNSLQCKLSEVVQSKEHLGESIGLINVIYRLRLYYGDHADIEIHGLKPYGLQVTLYIPLDGYDEEVVK